MPPHKTEWNELTITVSDTADDKIVTLIHEQIKSFNNKQSPHHLRARTDGPQPLLVVIRDERGRIVGGLTASTYWDWLDVDDLWVAEHLRGRSLGRQLLRMAEQAARERGCVRVMLSTFSFQARGFYEKEGYRVVGVLEDYPPGQALYQMRKDFSD